MSIRFQIPQDKIPTLGQRTFLQVEDQFVALFNVNQNLYAINDRCPHQGASLFGAKLEGKTIQCCAHGLKFDLATGYLNNSTHFKVTTYPLEKINDHVFIVMD
ncbi:Rieske (2Fe-2S) protein [Acinetobacter sp. Marseille-Q1618]|uniref:Rieske (2Fe-2S) protein n=1 Tax=Acinetobacter sp. Marseille-Q1618 TaxID=2697502 RepID=UPI00156E8AD0|nr:Rieske (2Fe-2S) protein [Acinetobacter sp. Marseille-Q1618]